MFRVTEALFNKFNSLFFSLHFSVCIYDFFFFFSHLVISNIIIIQNSLCSCSSSCINGKNQRRAQKKEEKRKRKINWNSCKCNVQCFLFRFVSPLHLDFKLSSFYFPLKSFVAVCISPYVYMNFSLRFVWY